MSYDDQTRPVQYIFEDDDPTVYAPRGPRQQQQPRGRGGCWRNCLFLGLLAVTFISVTVATVIGTTIYLRFSAELEQNISRLDDAGQRETFETSRITDRNGEVLWEIFGEGKRTYVPLDQIPQTVRDATIAVEDDTFYENEGADLPSLVAALMFGVPMLAGSPSAQDTDGLGADAARPPVDDGGPAHADPAGSLADQLCFLGDCLARDDRDALRRACAPDEPAPIHDLAFDWLRARHDARSLTRLYRGRRFPTEPGTFTLGGHDRELGHVHVEFRSDDGARWRLGKLWMCR